MVLQEKCFNATGDPQYFEKAVKSLEGFAECLDSVVNRTALSNELYEAERNGQLNEVFNRTCGKQDALFQCIEGPTTDMIKKCLTQQELNEIKSQIKISKRVLKYICDNDADMITQFWQNEGLECFVYQRHGYEPCFQETYSNFTNPNSTPITSITLNCEFTKQLQQCIVPELEKCETPIAAEFFNGIFNTAANVLDCNVIENNLIINDTLNSIY